MSSGVFRRCNIEVEGRPMTIDLVLLVIQHFDIILGMNWLSVLHGVIDYEHKKDTFQAPNQELFSCVTVVSCVGGQSLSVVEKGVSRVFI